MLKNVIGKLKEKTGKTKSQPTEANVPDLSRVLNLPNVTTPEDPAPFEGTAIPDEVETPLAQPTIIATPEDMADRAEEAIDSLSGQYEIWMRADLDRLIAAWNNAREISDTESYRGLFMTAHNIRGVAASYSYPAIGRLCASLCTLLSETQPGENDALINIHVEACRAAYNPVTQTDGANSVADAVCDALEARVNAKLSLVGGTAA